MNASPTCRSCRIRVLRRVSLLNQIKMLVPPPVERSLGLNWTPWRGYSDFRKINFSTFHTSCNSGVVAKLAGSATYYLLLVPCLMQLKWSNQVEPLIDLSSSVDKLDHFIRLNLDARSDIEWWWQFISRWNGISAVPTLLRQPPDIQFTTDA